MEICKLILTQLKKLTPLGASAEYTYRDVKSEIFTDRDIQFIRKAVSELPEHEKSLLYLYFWKNYSISEISSACDLYNTLIKNIMNQTIQKLRLLYVIEVFKPRDDIM